MKSLLFPFVLIAALVLSVFTETASAAQITVVSVAGNWHDPTDNVPGSQPGEPVITNGVPTSSINWGVTSGSQSGYDFSRLIPGPQTLPPAPTPFFPLGTFTHRNFPVSDPSLTSVKLDIVLVLNVDGVQTDPLTFTFTFHHEETPNNLSPCPYPTPAGEGCTDRVTFVSSPSPTTFNVGGVDYTLSMSFVNNGLPVAEFITREGLINTANLVGQFTLPPVPPGAPVLTVTKSGPATMNIGEWGNFAVDIRNTGPSDAWNASVRDVLPDGATGGMCDLTPEILSAQVFSADGVTPVAGKGPLSSGSDYSLNYSAAPNCQLNIVVLTAAGRIGSSERLIIRYRTQLDANSQNGVTLTNVAGAIQWFDSDSSNPSRVSFTRPLTNGTPGVLDHEDAFTVTVAISDYVFEKTVANLTSGANPASNAVPGNRLRYTLRFRTTNQPLNNFRIVDELDALNSSAAFAPGTLALVAYPAGADISNTSGTGGTKGTGLIDIRNLTAPATGEIVIQFDITLAASLSNGSVVANQSSLRLANGTTFALSDDPNVNGAANSQIPGDEDPTRLTIASAPAFRVQKISSDLTGDPNVLLAGETLRYTITVKNIGNDKAANVVLRDSVPVNTAYLAGSTRLNGAAMADSAGLSPLVNGMLINSPADATPGSMPADASGNSANVATITFDVVVSLNVVNGTVVSNQGFVTAVANGIVDFPSDDPNTSIANDPTRNIVGNLPLLYAEKRVALFVDQGAPGIIDPGDVLRYTISVVNSAAIPTTGVVLRDGVPANTTYVANSTLLNGLPVRQPDSGVSPLASGIDVSSSNLTPPLPGAGAGTISA
ncbi:MAG TPA: THxN family PEP-CTERM protein, partial [Terriglobia bacterium]|nr:THxN family PEP-CTERM protein [Terriglobia bacterium]